MKFNSKEYWEDRYLQGGGSGSGSYGRLATFKAETINLFCERHDIKRIIEWGCGDGNNCSLFNVEEYVGYDVSKTAIDICKKKIKHSGWRFIHYNGEQLLNIEKGDMSISLDVLYHLVESDAYDKYMNNLFESSNKWVAIYSFDGEIHLPTASHVLYREHSVYIGEHFKDFRLSDIVKNKYKRTEYSDPEDTSWCDFYFYERV